MDGLFAGGHRYGNTVTRYNQKILNERPPLSKRSTQPAHTLNLAEGNFGLHWCGSRTSQEGYSG